MEVNLEITTRCINCDVCRLICPEDSVHLHQHNYFIDSWSCTVCGLCVELCPTEAIQLKEEITD